VIAAGDTTSGRGKTAIINQIAPLIPELADRVERGVYISLLARQLGVSEQYIESALRQSARPATRQQQQPASAARIGPTRVEYLLSLLIRKPDAMPDLLAIAPEEIGDAFTDPFHRAIWDALVALAGDNEAYLDTEAVKELLPEVLADDIARLLSYTEQQDIWYVGRVVQEAEAQLRNLLRDHANTRIQEMNGLYADASAEGDEELMRYYAAEITRLSGLLKIYPPPSSVFRDLQSPRA
jgi:DNA primase